MRWSYLIPRAALLLLVWAFLAFGFDPLLRRVAMGSLQRAADAKAEIGGLETTFFPPSLTVRNARIANHRSPATNLVEFEDFHVELSGRPFLKRCFIVDEGRLSGLRWGTAREDSGLLDRSDGPGDKDIFQFDWLGRKFGDLGSDWLSVLGNQAEAMLDPRQLESVRLADELKTKWDARLKDLESRIRALQKRVKQIEETVEKAKGNVLERAAAYQKAAVEVNNVLLEAQRIRRELGELPALAQEDCRNIELARRRDFEALEKTLKILRLDPEAISDALLGPELAQRFALTAEWLQWLRQNIALASRRPEPERLRGEEILFPSREPLPKFLVRTLHVSGAANFGGDELPFAGTVSGLTSEPAVYGQPTTVHLAGEAGARFELDATLDYRTEIPIHDLALSYTSPSATQTRLGSGDRLALIVSAEQTQWKANVALTDNSVAGKLTLRQAPVRIVAQSEGDGRGEAVAVLQSALESVGEIEAAVTVSGTIDDPKWQLESNLGLQLAEGVNTLLSQQVETQRRELVQQADAAVREKTAGLNQMLQERYGALVGELTAGESQARKLVEQVTGRPIDLNSLFRR